MEIKAPLPVLLLDVGLAATGVAVATLRDDGVHVKLSVIEPAKGLSTAQQNEKRSCIYYGDLAERLFVDLRAAIDQCGHACHPMPPVVFAEVPSMGSINAGGMRSMSIAIAAYRAAALITKCCRADFIRNDVVVAALGTKRVTDETKLQTRALVSKLFVVDDSALPATKLVKHRRTGAMIPVEAIESLRDNAFDAAAVLFAARSHFNLKDVAGWGDIAMGRNDDA